MKSTVVSIIFAGVLIMVAMGSSGGEKSVNNVSFTEGKQIVAITAKGGYSPKVSEARADMPTVLRIKTNGTFDCSSALTIPSIGYRENLPPSGTTDIEILPQKSGTIMQGICSMGMYHFVVNFK